MRDCFVSRNDDCLLYCLCSYNLNSPVKCGQKTFRIDTWSKRNADSIFNDSLKNVYEAKIRACKKTI